MPNQSFSDMRCGASPSLNDHHHRCGHRFMARRSLVVTMGNAVMFPPCYRERRLTLQGCWDRSGPCGREPKKKAAHKCATPAPLERSDASTLCWILASLTPAIDQKGDFLAVP